MSLLNISIRSSFSLPALMSFLCCLIQDSKFLFSTKCREGFRWFSSMKRFPSYLAYQRSSCVILKGFIPSLSKRQPKKTLCFTLQGESFVKHTKTLTQGGLCPKSIFPSPEEREYRERWSPFRQRGRGISKNTFFDYFLRRKLLNGSSTTSPCNGHPSPRGCRD